MYYGYYYSFLTLHVYFGQPSITTTALAVIH